MEVQFFATSNADYNSLFLNITDSEFSNNQCYSAGAALRLELTVKANIKNCLFTENKVFPSLGMNTYNFLDYTNSTDYYITNGGGAILFTGSTTSNKTNGHIKISDCTFKNNSSTSRGAALYISGANNSESYITRNKFISNTAGISRAAIEYVQSNKNPGTLAAHSNDLIITDNLFYDNKSVYYGGAISVTAACPIILANNAFFKNAITGTTVESISQAPKREIGSGAAIHFASSGAYQGDLRKVIANCIFSENTAPTGSNYTNIVSGTTTATGSYTKNSLFLDGNGFTSEIDASVKTPNNSSFTNSDIFKSTNPLSSHFLRLNTMVSGNPAINTGLNTITRILPSNSSIIFTTDSLDLSKQSRILNTTIDIGAYEAHPLSAETLPVEFISFDINNRNNNVQLIWKVAAETNNKEFIIERSVDGKEFKLIGTRKSLGNTSNITNYSFIDLNPLNGTTYYKLSQIDLNGTTKVLAIKSLNSNINNSNLVFPVPAKDVLNIKINQVASDNITIDLIAISGKKVISQSFNKETITQAIQLNLNEIVNGIYILNISNGILSEKKLITISK